MKRTIINGLAAGLSISMLAACGGSSTNSTSSGSKLMAITAACYAAWNGGTVYTGGQTASYNGVNYTAAYWTLNQNPSTNNGPAGSGQPWISNGACGSTPTPTPTPAPTPTPTPAPTPTPTPAPTPTPTPAPTPTLAGVTLFQDCNYTGGWSATFGAGSYHLSDITAKGGRNDDASSIRIPAGYTVTLYRDDNFTGTSVTLTADNSCFTGINFNDALSSMVVSTGATPTPTPAPTPTPTPAPTPTGTCVDPSGSVANYVEAYKSATTRWCVDPTVWAGHSADIQKFFAYGESVITNLQTLFGVSTSLPFVYQVDYPNGGAHTGSNFGNGDSVTGDAFYNTYTGVADSSGTQKTVAGFWGYLLTLHEAINVWTGTVSQGWPVDWWADHRSPFPNSMDYHVMKTIGDAQGNTTLQNAAGIQHYRFGVSGYSGYDSEVAMDDTFYNNYGGYTPFVRLFSLMKTDGLHWNNVAADPSTLLTEYVIAYTQLGLRTATDLTTSSFINSGVGKLDTTIAAYTPSSAHVMSIANAHCSIAGARTDPAVTSTQINNALSALRSGNYAGATIAQRSCTQTPSASAPAECKCSSSSSKWVAPWAP